MRFPNTFHEAAKWRIAMEEFGAGFGTNTKKEGTKRKKRSGQGLKRFALLIMLAAILGIGAAAVKLSAQA